MQKLKLKQTFILSNTVNMKYPKTFSTKYLDTLLTSIEKHVQSAEVSFHVQGYLNQPNIT